MEDTKKKNTQIKFLEIEITTPEMKNTLMEPLTIQTQ